MGDAVFALEQSLDAQLAGEPVRQTTSQGNTATKRPSQPRTRATLVERHGPVGRWLEDVDREHTLEESVHEREPPAHAGERPRYAQPAASTARRSTPMQPSTTSRRAGRSFRQSTARKLRECSQDGKSVGAADALLEGQRPRQPGPRLERLCERIPGGDPGAPIEEPRDEPERQRVAERGCARLVRQPGDGQAGAAQRAEGILKPGHRRLGMPLVRLDDRFEEATAPAPLAHVAQDGQVAGERRAGERWPGPQWRGRRHARVRPERGGHLGGIGSLREREPGEVVGERDAQGEVGVCPMLGHLRRRESDPQRRPQRRERLRRPAVCRLVIGPDEEPRRVEKVLERAAEPEVLRRVGEQEAAGLGVDQRFPAGARAGWNLRADEEQRTADRVGGEHPDGLVEPRVVRPAGVVDARVEGEMRDRCLSHRRSGVVDDVQRAPVEAGAQLGVDTWLGHRAGCGADRSAESRIGIPGDDPLAHARPACRGYAAQMPEPEHGDVGARDRRAPPWPRPRGHGRRRDTLTTPLPTICILAGGLGTRLGERVATTPKPLLELAGEPFLLHQLRLLAGHDARHVVLCVGYHGNRIEHRIGSEQFGIRIEYSHDAPGLDGTLGAIRRALPLLPDRFLVLYGDAYLRLDYRAAARAWEESGRLGLMTVLHNEGRWGPSNAAYADGRVFAYDKASPSPELGWIDYGLGGFRESALQLSRPTSATWRSSSA